MRAEMRANLSALPPMEARFSLPDFLIVVRFAQESGGASHMCCSTVHVVTTIVVVDLALASPLPIQVHPCKRPELDLRARTGGGGRMGADDYGVSGGTLPKLDRLRAP